MHATWVNQKCRVVGFMKNFIIEEMIPALLQVKPTVSRLFFTVAE